MNMKIISKLSISFLIFFITASISYAAFFETGAYLVKGWRSHQKVMLNQGSQIDYIQASEYVAYIKGVIDATEGSYFLKEGVTVDQVISIVGKYLDSHPEEWNEKGSDLIIKALNQAFKKS